ncbi:MAG: tRNA (adenosine(37)-N6)-threonylcarbamoyltransferase complex transferase subunit TsaD, partial [Candidatus Levybacteria bacterium]|nr:tRNA (adenosine(37)-N6)-threonylcarbamoyltransferase complex transferase subunit TsaD [Candidatus Levybacteria bacterium]
MHLLFSKDKPEIDAIAVTVGPGLIGSLLVGVETAKSLFYIWNKPIIPVNHLLGHIYANFVSQKSNIKTPKFPDIGLIVSGGHTDLVLIKKHGKIEWIGGTKDDAAGEALDKTGRLLGLPYPAGPKIEELAKKGIDSFHFPRPLINDPTYDFSFSGLKTAVLREIQKLSEEEKKTKINDLCASVQQAVIDVLVSKLLKAAKENNVKSI